MLLAQLGENVTNIHYSRIARSLLIGLCGEYRYGLRLTSAKIEALTDRAAMMKKAGEARPHRSGVFDETNE
jgi:hypothetical protein